jgi:uncharacterized protein
MKGKKPLNPFVLTGYLGKEYFCNREKQIKELQNHLRNDRNIVIYSWRRLGKSALIYRLFDEIFEKNKVETLYVDLMATANLSEALQQIIEAVYFKFGKTNASIGQTFLKILGSLGVEFSIDPLIGVPSISLGLKANQPSEVTLFKIFEFLNNRKEKLVIAIDEFQQITHYENNNAEAVFRNIMQQFPSIRFIFSGSHKHLMSSMFAEKNRPFYRSCQTIHLLPIDKSDYSDFIKSQFTSGNKNIEDECIDMIYTWSRGQTFSIQLLCNRLYGDYKNVRPEELDITINNILQQDASFFAHYQHILPKNQWNLLKAIAKEDIVESPTAMVFLKKYNLGAASSVSTALKKLLETELIIHENGTFYIQDILLSRWLRTI